MARVGVVGAGYVGLTTAACLASLGHEVVCGDLDADRVARLSAGEVPILEAGLDDLVADGLRSGRLRFVVGAPAAARDNAFVFLCVPTPQGDDGAADLSYVRRAAKEISDVLIPGAVVVNKSTVPVGSVAVVEQELGRADVAVVSNPEFLREGTAVSDFLHPDRVVVGAHDAEVGAAVAALYDHLGARVVLTDPASAETIKYASNAFLATKLSFVNDIAAVCEAVGADVDDVMTGVGLDPRIGSAFLRPGPGWGGSCFPKDSLALLKLSRDVGVEFGLLAAAVHANHAQFDRVVAKVASALGGELRARTVAVWGLTFKAGTDDLRDSPALAVTERLVARGARVQAFDPTVSTRRDPIPAEISLHHDPCGAAAGADVVVVLTEWPHFTEVDPSQVRAVMDGCAVVDARNVLDRRRWVEAGFGYIGVGRS